MTQCKNGATCVEDSSSAGGRGFRCNCVTPYIGDTCENGTLVLTYIS